MGVDLLRRLGRGFGVGVGPVGSNVLESEQLSYLDGWMGGWMDGWMQARIKGRAQGARALGHPPSGASHQYRDKYLKTFKFFTVLNLYYFVLICLIVTFR